MPIIEVQDVECPYCGEVADVEIDDTLTEPQFDECETCGDEYQITWDPAKKTATVEVLPDDENEDLTLEDLDDLDEDDEDFA